MPPIRVLYVDDDPSFADLTTAFLEREIEDVDVVTETSPREAVAVLGAEGASIDCIVSDYDMQERNGLDFLEVVRREYDELPFILFTGKGSEEIASEAIAAGVTDYLQKGGPEQYTVLANRICNAVEQYRSARTAERSERRLQELAEKSNDTLWMYTDDWSELVFVNSAVEELFEVPADQLRAQPRSFLDAIHPGHRDRVERAMDRLSAGRSVDIEYRVDEAAEYQRWARVQAEPVFGADGAVERIVGFTRDITAHRERERALQALNDVAVDLDSCETVIGICERTVDASQEILEFDLSVIDLEENGHLSKAALSEELTEAETASMSIEEGIAGKTYRTGESMLVDDVEDVPEAKPQGPFRSAISIPIGTDGVFQAVAEEPDAFEETDLELAELLISHTVSALERLDREQQLHHQNERLEEFTRIVSHDLRNPLNVLDGSLELVREECDSPHLTTAREALTRMETMVEDTLTLATEGQIVDEMTAVSLDSIARDCWQTVRTQSATLEVTTDRSIRADPDRLRHVFENVFCNAVEHVGPDVTVRVGEFDDGFYVEDDGTGIPDERREQVFEPGYTATNGSGFGLAIVQQVAEAHEWTVRVTDGTDGGARFEFSGVDSPRWRMRST